MRMDPNLHTQIYTQIKHICTVSLIFISMHFNEYLVYSVVKLKDRKNKAVSKDHFV